MKSFSLDDVFGVFGSTSFGCERHHPNYTYCNNRGSGDGHRFHMPKSEKREKKKERAWLGIL